MCSSDGKWIVLAQGWLHLEAQQLAIRIHGQRLAQPSWLGTQSWAVKCPRPARSAALLAQTPFTMSFHTHKALTCLCPKSSTYLAASPLVIFQWHVFSYCCR